MPRDIERIERVQAALQEQKLDAIVCTLPRHVLMLSGYWPVLGTAIAAFTTTGQVTLLVPEDEKELAEAGWADEILTFSTGSLQTLTKTIDTVRKPLQQILRSEVLSTGAVGLEEGPAMEPASYVGMHLYGGAMNSLLQEVLPNAHPCPADDLLQQLSAAKTALEIEKIQTACRIAEQAFLTAVPQLSAGLRETEAAALFTAPLSTDDVELTQRAGGQMFCMSGPNSYNAFAAYQRSRQRVLESGDLVLLHCNSFADGFWTDITRTYCLAEPDMRQRPMYEAVLEARAAALSAIRPGARASDVDRAARQVMEKHQLGREFKHALGHGVGFAAIDHNQIPRLHPLSPDVLQEGMIFNVEPAAYIEGFGGLRHCDMVVVTADGARYLTSFQSGIEELALG